MNPGFTTFAKFVDSNVPGWLALTALVLIITFGVIVYLSIRKDKKREDSRSQREARIVRDLLRNIKK